MILTKGMLPTVYMIDKDPAVIDMISILLRDEGYLPIVGPKPFDIHHLQRAAPHLILLHNGLDNSGLEICMEIKGNAILSTIPVILSSTRSDLPKIAKECGADAYIIKPFDINIFCDLIRNTLRNNLKVE